LRSCRTDGGSDTRFGVGPMVLLPRPGVYRAARQTTVDGHGGARIRLVNRLR